VSAASRIGAHEALNGSSRTSISMLKMLRHDAEEPEACFQRALASAQQQEAKALELRAAMSLSRLWQAQGKYDAARTLLAGTYGWFTKGFDTAHLQEAKALLAALG
jgi:predicted ATPase